MGRGREGAAGGPAAPRVDPTVVTQLLSDLGPRSVVEVCDVFLADGRERLDAIRLACTSEDAATAAGSAHRLKSAAGFLGVSRVALMCIEIEALARDERLGEVARRVEVVSEELEAAVRELGDLVRTAGRPDAGAGEALA